MAEDFHAGFFYQRNFFIEYFLGKSVLRNAVAEHTAGLVHHIVNSHAVTHDVQIIGGCQSRRARADDRNLFAAAHHHIGKIALGF